MTGLQPALLSKLSAEFHRLQDRGPSSHEVHIVAESLRSTRQTPDYFLLSRRDKMGLTQHF